MLKSKNLGSYSYKAKGFVKAININLQDPWRFDPQQKLHFSKFKHIGISLMVYKGSTLLCHLVFLGTLLVGVYTLRSVEVNVLFLHQNMNDILLESSDLSMSCKISYILWSYKSILIKGFKC